MELSNKIAIISIIITFIFSSISVVISLMSKKESKIAEKISTNTNYIIAELKIFETIYNAKRDAEEAVARPDITGEEKINYITAKIEAELNAYDIACQAYLDDKIDRNRFVKTYRMDIYDLFQRDLLKDKLRDINSRYDALNKVYIELFKIESKK